MNIQFYNSLTKNIENFKSINQNKVLMYTCGPTVYNFVHIGNLRSFIFSDILSKSLIFFGYEVVNVMNLTDVDDKTIRDSKKELPEIKNPNERLIKFTQKYSDFFLEDLKKLNVNLPKHIVKATDSIGEMRDLIEELYQKGFAYFAEDGIYFNVDKNQKYGQLVNIDKDNQKKNSENRVVDDEYDKDNAQDFALWKFKKDQDEPSWKIKIGDQEVEGRPGWHIECSAMSKKILGSHFDIHTGGVDLKFPHHENEIAQSECANSCKYSNFFMHNEFLLVDNAKMAKSLNNFYTLRDLVDKGYSELAIREVFIRSHYRSPLNFTFDSLKQGEANVKKINDFYQKYKNLEPQDTDDSLANDFKKSMDEFEIAIADDLNTAEAMAAMYNFMNRVNKEKVLSQNDLNLVIEFMERVDLIFSLLIKEEVIPTTVVELAAKRKIARDNKDFNLSDELRDQIQELGYNVKDSKESKIGYILSKK